MKRLSLLLLVSAAISLRSLSAEPVRVVSFSTILTEIATNVGGEVVAVRGLVKPGVDPHEY